MISLFHLFPFLGALLGLLFGAGIGHQFGILGAGVGAVAGSWLGFLVGGLPWRIGDWFIRRELGAKSTPQLWSDLKGADCEMPNHVLLELRRRGEPMEEGLNVVLSLLTSEDRGRRLQGFAALLSAFPEQARRLKDYSPDAPDATRREIVNQARLAASGKADQGDLAS